MLDREEGQSLEVGESHILQCKERQVTGDVREGGRPDVGATYILQCRERQVMSIREIGQRWKQLTDCNVERGR